MANPVDAVWCFQCGTEYQPDVAECVECGVATVPEPPREVTDVGSAEEQQLAYEFHSWALESRSMLDSLLTGGKVDHAWQGATLIIREEDEGAVDRLVEDVERTTLPTLDPEAEKTAYGLEEFSTAQVGKLTDALGLAGIAHDFDAEGDLIIHAADEEATDEVFEKLNDEPERFGPGVEGVDANEVMSSLFFSSSDLSKGVADSKAVRSFVDTADLATQMELPFGLDSAVWRRILEQNQRVLEALHEDEDEADDEEGGLRFEAGTLRDLLHPLV
jgi:hypothetical protein